MSRIGVLPAEGREVPPKSISGIRVIRGSPAEGGATIALFLDLRSLAKKVVAIPLLYLHTPAAMKHEIVEERPHPGLFSTELANSITHGVGLALSIGGLSVLVVMAALRGSARHVVACSIYGATLVFLYLASTLYHSIQKPRAKRVLRAIDHSAIYLLIAGTYTPFTIAGVRGGWGWSIFGVAWGLALAGILFKIFFTGRFKAVSLIVYLGMGWMSLILIKPLLDSISLAGVLWLAGGGLAYSLGAIFYVWKSMPHHHAVWHLFVMAGSACHFFAVMFYVLPNGG